MFAPLVPQTSVLFVSQASLDNGTVASYNLKKRVEAVRGCRTVTKKDMAYNDAMPKMKVDPERYTVEADGKLCTAEPAVTLPLAQDWFVY
jgi:urease